VRVLTACSDALPWDKPSMVESHSHSGEGLIVRVLANASCGGLEPVAPEARVDGQDVRISWSWYSPPDTALAACLCTRRLEFVVPHAVHVSKPSITLSEDAWKQ